MVNAGSMMQFQSDIARCRVWVPDAEELSGIGVAYMAGMAMGIWNETIFERIHYTVHEPQMDGSTATSKYDGWQEAVAIINH